MSSTKWVVNIIAQVKWLFLLGILMLVIKTIANLSLIGVQKFIIDEILLEEQFHLTTLVLTCFAIAIVSYNFFHLVGDRVRHKFQFGIQRRLYSTLLEKIYRLPTGHIQNERTAKFVHYFTDDLNRISGMIGHNIPNGIGQLVSVIILGTIITIASPVLFFSILAVSILYIVLGKHFGPRIRSLSKEMNEKKSEFLVQMEEGIAATREIVAYHRISWERNRFLAAFKQYFDRVMKEGKLQNKQTFLSDPLKWSTSLVVLGYGGYLVIQGSLSIGLFIIVFQYSRQLMDAFHGLYQFFMGMSNQMACVDRFKAVMDQEEWKEGEHMIQGSITSLRFENVRFRYSSETPWVLDGLDLEIPMGKKVAIVGTSGGGKSTIAQLLICFFEPTEGKIRVDGQSLQEIKREDWSKRVHIVFQEPYLFPDTIQNNIVLGREVQSERSVQNLCQQVHIGEFIENLPEKYETEVGERGIKLSGGQRQRLAMARALLSDPDILILDEATSALDLETERHLQKQIDEVRKKKTTIIIAHRLSTVQNADVIYVMEKGKVVEKGTHEELMRASKTYERLVLANSMAEKQMVI